MSEMHKLAEEIKGLPAPQQLELAVALLRQSEAAGGDLRLTRVAHSIVHRVATDLGAALALHDLKAGATR